ncbi:MAG: lipoate--protein ligase family protein [Opitutaceae bacterium]|nr:lipoate--protein ligase family protein [Opitutaceae bacterium]
MKLHLLPTRTGGAAENMALDFLLLQRYPCPAAPRFRHYEWREPAFTFGFGQKIEFVRERLPAGEQVDLCRRPTGGGLVDHRHDWTYALVLPRGHALYDVRATESYRAVHEGLAVALKAIGQPAVLQAVPGARDDAGGGAVAPGVCFQRAELYDVINERTGAKIAGAAQKRNQHGLLIQGSIEKGSIAAVDWDEFQTRFTDALAATLGAEAAETPWPDLNDDEVSGLVEQYSSSEWLEYR